jgi:hypothetical protein
VEHRQAKQAGPLLSPCHGEHGLGLSMASLLKSLLSLSTELHTEPDSGSPSRCRRSHTALPALPGS